MAEEEEKEQRPRETCRIKEEDRKTVCVSVDGMGTGST